MNVPRLLTTLLPLFTATAFCQLPAFPGAEGYGSIATGGRGGDVYHVTNLSASGVGSFAYGVQNAPVSGRTIVFDVSGHIRLSSGSGGGLTISKDKITVAGQTAPGDGICFWNNTMNITGDDLVFRNVRWRYGYSSAGGDSVDINGSERIIFDHCDVMFGTDENMSSFGTAPEHLTFQWSANAWGLYGHSAGGLWKTRHATVHHTLWANNHTRNPKLIGCDVFDWVNNLTFGWDLGFNMAQEFTGGTGVIYRVNIRNSSFIHGGSTGEAIYGGGTNDDGSKKFRLHMSDSALDGNNNGVLDVSRSNYSMIASGTTYESVSTPWPQTTAGNPANAVVGVPVSVSPRLTGYKKILSQTGAVRMEIGARPLRDEITALCITRAAALQRGAITNPTELNLSTGTAFADLQSASPPADTDQDGMPDDWEDAVGYDKALADHNTLLTVPQTATSFFTPGSPAGYTRLEEYLHFKAVPHGTVAKNTAASPTFIDVDLTKFTSGFTNNTVFTISSVVNGSVSQSGPGGSLLRFTPPVDVSGRAGFHFTVTDAAGDSWTQQCCLLISTKAQPRPVTWTGDGASNQWNTTTPNFSSFLGPTAFAAGDAVTINDSGSNTPGIQINSPSVISALVVNNALKNFTLEGSGSLSGTAGLTKTGAGSLTLKVNFPGTGTGSIDGGQVILGGTSNAGSLPSGQLELKNGAVIKNSWPSSSSTQNISAPLWIPEGHSATIQTGRRVQLGGAVTGSGNLNIVHQGTDGLIQLRGSMNAFAGNLQFTYTGTNPAMSAVFNGASFTGWSGANVLIPSPLVLACTTNSTGNTFGIGSLSGTGTLGGGSAGAPNYTIGGLNADSTFGGAFSGNARLTKTGSGTLTLTGNSVHTGTTSVNAGNLMLSGSFGTSAVTVANAAILSGTGTLGGSLATSAGGILSPGADKGDSAGTLTAASLNLTSPALRFQLSDNPLAGNDRIQVSGNGAIQLTGAQNFMFDLINGDLSPGTYELINTAGTLTATGATLASNLPSGSRQSLVLEHSTSGAAPGYVRLVVAGTNADLLWTGNGGGIWDLQSTASWSGASPATFFNYDKVTFDDTAVTGNVSITRPVAPQSLIVNNTAARPYTFTGAPITGSTSLVKSGPGILTLNLPQYTFANSSTTVGSPTVTVSSTTNLLPGMTVTGGGIPSGTTIVSVVSPTSLQLSQNATATSTTVTLTIETRHSYQGGTFLNGGTVSLTSNATPLSAPSAPANPYGLGTGPITFNGGTLTLQGHTGSSGYLDVLYGPLPNDLIVPAGQSGTLNLTIRGNSAVPFAALTGSLTGSGVLNLTTNYYRAAITGDWSAFSGSLNVKRPTSGVSVPRFQIGAETGMPLAAVHMEQLQLDYTAVPPPEGATVNFGSLSGISSAVISGSQNATGPVTWRVGGLDTSVTFAGSFTPFTSGGGPIGLAKTGSGTWTLTGSGTVSAGITVEEGTISYGDSSTDSIAGTSAIAVWSGAVLQLNAGATLNGVSLDVSPGAVLRGRGTVNAETSSSGSVEVSGGTLAFTGDTYLGGSTRFAATTDRISVAGALTLAGQLQLPSTGLAFGRLPLITYSGALSLGGISFTPLPSGFYPVLDAGTPGEIAVNLVDLAAYQIWQTARFGNTTDPQGQPEEDPDGDGMINLEEYEAGTNPQSAASYLPLIWQGGGANNWDLAITSNWLENTTPRVFRNNRHITFSDAGLNSPAIRLSGPLEPGSLTVSNTAKAFTLDGEGSLEGSMSLTKQGTGGLTILTSNTFAGAFDISAGVVTIGMDTALGNADGATTVSNNARLELQSGITVTGEPLSITGQGGASFFNGALNSRSGTNIWNGPVTLSANGTRIGAQAGATLEVRGPISSAPGVSGLVVRPNDMTSTVILSGANDFAGDTTIAGGWLKLGATGTLPEAGSLKFGLSNVSGKMDLRGYDQQIGGVSVAQTSGVYTNEITNSGGAATLAVVQNVTNTTGILLTGNLSLVKSGSAAFNLAAGSNYTGNTTVEEGVLSIGGTTLSAGSLVRLDGVLGLTASSTVSGLKFGGNWQPAGTYHSANSSGRLTGTGSLVVTGSGPPEYAAWIDAHAGLSAQDRMPSADPDGDGSNNLAEYAFGGDPVSASDSGARQFSSTDLDNDSLPDLVLTIEVLAGSSFSQVGGVPSATAGGVVYRIEGTGDLAAFSRSVVEVVPHMGQGVAAEGYVFKTFRLANPPPGNPRGFLRASASLP